MFDTADQILNQVRAGEDGRAEFKEVRLGERGVVSPNTEDCEHDRAAARPVLTPPQTDFVSWQGSVGPAGQHASRCCLAGRAVTE